MRKFVIAPLVLAISLSGCAVGPDYQTPTTSMAETYLYADQNGVSRNAETEPFWWTEFNDPTLNDLVLDMQSQNIPLKVAAERIKMADSYKSVVESFKVPTINVGAGYVNYQLSKNDSLLGPALNPIGDSAAGLPPQIANTTLLDNQHDGVFAGASIAWELDLFGRIDRQSNAAQIRVEQAEIYQSGLTTLLTADLIHNYLQYQGASERLDLAKSNLEDQRKTMDLVEKVVRSGYGSDLDLAQAKATLAAMESIIPQLEIAQQVHKHRIAVLLGEPLSKVEVRLAETQGVPAMQNVVPIGLPSDLLQRRPDIRLAEREMAAINEELAASIANQYPKFFLTGAPSVSASSFDDLFSSDSFGWVGAAGISWNVFDGGRGDALEDINQARFEAATLTYQHAVDSAFAEVDSTLFAYGKSQENQRRIDDALVATGKAVGKAKSLYRAGLIDHLSVLDAQRQQRMMQDRQIAAKLQTAQVTVALYKSLGGDWALEQSPQS
ncbi:efflux transporter outer membrane subunit [Vibrio owensii]|uniref:Efflux transporter outer membrane subunit n=1 Tax=Vibrio owensii TaxID=696485 RepID=A0AAP9GGP3_9VIBR|nr:efflux transporter outer membrane subunit [Vibrio owensii]AYO17776.1 efflux transporter outer membrane subunit [Vibrio owensii]QGH49881.1 efflux transporter outer membrane subunit [Vibrio owensii]